jgi:hypothetical protein
MGTDEPPQIVVPIEEVERQAGDVIAALDYQLYQTVSTWMSLKIGEQLFVEMAEDFAVSTKTALNMTQVKRTAAAVTLRSKGVAALISSVWSFQEANPGTAVSAAYLTTSRIGKEKGLTFPSRMTGLSYWRVGAREQADVEPLRTALLKLDLAAALKTFLKNASPDDMRTRILRPIHWYTAASSQDALERDLEERLVYYGQARGVGAQDARNALNALVVELHRCVRRPVKARFVTAADFSTIFEKNTYRLVPPTLLPSEAAAPSFADHFTALAVTDAASIPLPPRATMRQNVVTSLHEDLVRDGIVWLQGSSGLGKTTMALLIARYQNASWQFADLRNLAEQPLRLTLTRLAMKFSAASACGLILDDLPSDLDNASILALRRVARAVAEVDGLLIVTSPKSPFPSLRSSIDLKVESVKVIPHLTEQDIDEMVANAGGDAVAWGRTIALSTGGHPQLVDARILGLQQRDWPKDDLWTDILPRDPNKGGDVEQERQAVRVRLLREMNPSSREMLFRLSLLTNAFDRPIALATATASPAIAQPGLHFDALIGPWIEQVGPERYRLSQLLRDSGEQTLDDDIKPRVCAAVVEHLLTAKPFPADQFMLLFIFAFRLGDARALNWFSAAIVGIAHTDKTNFKRVAEELSVFAQVDRGAEQPLFADDREVSAMLRYVQLLVSIAVNDLGAAIGALDRGLAETAELAGELKTSTLGLILSNALMERSLPLRPKRWLAMLKMLGDLPEIGAALRNRPKTKNPFSGLNIAPSHEEVLFASRASALTSIAELEELIVELDKLPARTRAGFLTAAASIAHSSTHIVSSAWLAEVARPDFDAKASAASLSRLRVAIKSWDNPDLPVELACAEAVMLDEYAQDQEAALAVLADAQTAHPDDYRINRQRQKVYYRNGQHAEALTEFERFANSLDRTTPVESAFSLREAGRSAAEVGELERARAFFGRAWEALSHSNDHVLPLKAGLSGDCAILDYKAGKSDEAIALMVRALKEAEHIDPTAGLKEHYCKLILVAALLWMRGARADWPMERQAMVIGMCSNPDPPPEVQQRPLSQPQLAWYELAELEAETSDSTIALTELRRRTKSGKGLLPLELMLAGHLVEAATRRLDIDGFIDAMRVYPRAVDMAVQFFPQRVPEDILNMPLGMIKPLTVLQWQEPSLRETVRSAVLLFALAALAQGRRDVYDAFRKRCENTIGLSTTAQSLFHLIDDPPEKSSEAIASVAKVVHHMRDRKFLFDAQDLFAAVVVVVQLLSGHVLGEIVAKPVLVYFRLVWEDIMLKRTFSMRHPSATGPLVLAAFGKGATNVASLARVALAAEAAVKDHLSSTLRANLHRIAEPIRKPVDHIDFSVKSKS